MERKFPLKCQKCGKVMEETKHKHFPNETSNVFKAICINMDCSELGKTHVMMEAILVKE